MTQFKTPIIVAFCLGILQLSFCDITALSAAAGRAPADGATPFRFSFDGPVGTGWGRPKDVARIYFPERLPAFFSKTILLDTGVPSETTLSWIFTGRLGGFSVEVSHAQIRVYQRFYDSYGLNDDHTSNPERIVQDSAVPPPDPIHSVTVILDAHLMLEVRVNNSTVIRQRCVLDVTRHQIQFQGPRTKHLEVAGALLPMPAKEAVVAVDVTHRHQTILGFGGIASIPAYLSLSEEGKKGYWAMLARYNLLIDREYPMGSRLRPDMSNLETLADASPHYYGDNFPNGEVSDFSYNAKIKRMGGKVVYELWALPSWATKDYIDADGKKYQDAADPEIWARAMLNYSRRAEEKTGYPPDVIGIQNEVIQPRAILLEMVGALRAKLDAAGLGHVKIQMPDASSVRGGVKVANTLRSDPGAWNMIDMAAAHEYDYQDHFADPDAFDDQMKELRAAIGNKPFLATEISLNRAFLQIPSYRVAFNVGQLYHKNMTLLDSIGLLYCWLILDVEQPNFGASRALLVPDPYHGDIPVPSGYQLRVLGAYSRHLREGMVRVDAGSSDSDLLVTAYEGSAAMRTLIATNRGTDPKALIVNWRGTAWKYMERVSQYAENAPETVPTQIVIQPGEIVTLSTIGISMPLTGAPAVVN